MNRSWPITLKRIWTSKPATRLLLSALTMAGFMLQGLLPGLDLAFRGDFHRSAFGIEAAICHSSPTEQAARTADLPGGGEEGQSDSHGCCLVCQTAGLAKGSPPTPTFTRPTLGTAEALIAARNDRQVDRRASRQNYARAPPVSVA